LKSILIFMIKFFLISSIFSIQIEKITDISNGEILFEYDLYRGFLTGIENRLFAQNGFKLEEFLISDDGNLNRISMFENKNSQTAVPLIHEDRLYILRNERFLNTGKVRYVFRVFDISNQPMTEIPNINFSWDSHSIPNIYGFDDYILFTYVYDFIWEHGHQIPVFETLKICKETWVVLEHLDSFANTHTRNFNSVFSFITDYDHTNLNLTFYELVDFQFEHISDLLIPYHSSPVEIYFDETYFTIIYQFNVTIIDVSDITNPQIIHDIPMPFDDFHLVNAIYTGEHLLTSDSVGRFRVFSLDDYSLVSIKPLASTTAHRNLYFYEPFVFHQNGLYLNAYDSRTAEFDRVLAYGQYNFYVNYTLSFQPDDLYYLKLCYDTFSYEIYSVLKNELIANVQHEELGIEEVATFHISNDRLYAFKWRQDGGSFFEIHRLENTYATLIQRVSMPGLNNFIISNNTAFLTLASGTVSVYDLFEDSFTYLGSFSGNIQNSFGDKPPGFIINNLNNEIIFRDADDYTNVIFQKTVPENRGQVRYYDDNYLLVSDGDFTNPIQRMMKFDIENEDIQQIHQFDMSDEANYKNFNKVISNDAWYRRDISEYFSIINDQVVKIGEMDNKDRVVYQSVFYPEQNKMVLINLSGIWVYDIEFKEYVSGDDIVILPLRNELLSNYPNPFNPETTISYILQADTHVSINIYNIRGQKVKSLVNEFKTSGNHQVMWNGTDDKGLPASSGIYFYRMHAKEFMQAKKMILIK